MELIKHKLRLAMPAITYMIIYLCWFYIIEHIPGRDYTIIHMKADDRIPFCEYFIIPYFMWFGYVAWILFYLFFKIFSITFLGLFCRVLSNYVVNNQVCELLLQHLTLTPSKNLLLKHTR